MTKKVINVILIFCFSFMAFVPLKANASEETLGDLRRNYENLLKEKQENDNKSDQAKKDIAAKEAAIKTAEANIAAAQKEEREVQEQIMKSNEKIDELTETAKNVLVYLQEMQSQNAYVEYVTGASSVTDLIMRIATFEQISDNITTTMTNLEAEIKHNEELKLELQRKQEALKKQIAEYQAAIKRQYSNLENYDKYALGINEKVQVAKAKYEANKRVCQNNLGRSDDSVKISECSKVPVNGGWLKPLTHGYITSNIGSRWGSYHNALDIGGNSEGTPVYAAAAGIVSGKIYKYSCGGNMLYIDVTVNGVQYTTYYYHLIRFNVNVGDVVDQNTVIGYVGGYSTASQHGGYDNCTTGAHLHFGVAKGWFTGTINRGNVITPPGFPNQEGYRFYSRTDYYR